MPLIVFEYFRKKKGMYKVTFVSCLPFRYHSFADNDTKGVSMNDIINILRLEDDSVNVIDITITGDTRTVSLEKGWNLYTVLHACAVCILVVRKYER